MMLTTLSLSFSPFLMGAASQGIPGCYPAQEFGKKIQMMMICSEYATKYPKVGEYFAQVDEPKMQNIIYIVTKIASEPQGENSISLKEFFLNVDSHLKKNDGQANLDQYLLSCKKAHS